MSEPHFHIKDLLIAGAGQMFPVDCRQVTAGVMNHMTGFHLNTFELIDAAAQARPALFWQFPWLEAETISARRLLRSTFQRDHAALDCRIGELSVQYGEYHIITPLRRYEMGRARTFAAALQRGRGLAQSPNEPPMPSL